MVSAMTPMQLGNWIGGERPLALLDVREPGEYNTAHIPNASLLPRRQLEARLHRLVPCRTVRLVLYDDDGRRAALAAVTAERMGYRRVSVLKAGINRWASDGFLTEWGMNVPSKDFGEAVEVRHHVPAIAADELQRRIAAGEKLVILDTRTPEEFRRACIPGGRSVPGGELAVQIADIARENPGATVVVNCAGRTRSIIGARLLQRMGIDNVLSLRNGTSGWVLAGHELERGAGRTEPRASSPEGRAFAADFAERVAAEDGVHMLSVAGLQDALARREGECVYLLDVRTEAEFERGHIAGFTWFPGGQAVQRCDDVVAVRGATVVFACDDSVRSTITASWYQQMGYPNACALNGGIAAWRSAGLPVEAGPDRSEVVGLAEAAAAVRGVAPLRLLEALGTGGRPLVIYVDPSDGFARGHVSGATWLPRGWLELRYAGALPYKELPVTVTDEDGTNASLAAATLKQLGYRELTVLTGGMAAWRAAGLPIEQGLSGVMAPPDDVVPAGPERSHADMIHYLRWEEALGRKYAAE